MKGELEAGCSAALEEANGICQVQMNGHTENYISDPQMWPLLMIFLPFVSVAVSTRWQNLLAPHFR